MNTLHLFCENVKLSEIGANVVRQSYCYHANSLQLSHDSYAECMRTLSEILL